ncbi:MAG: MdtA/MuxA family multidrug efflux RND transporter periplasmic adaptor subunit [Alphaproteobacteria bacterium]|nr:MdtA/MuxA family multidrug efflux RND transporter periplasmic adaptor subunit [Alphaproteobacteria bacterium]
MDKDLRTAPRTGSVGGDALRQGQAGFLRRNQRFGWLLLGVVLVAALVHWLAPSGPQLGRSGHYGSEGPIPVGVAVAARQNVHVWHDGLGTVTPLATVSVRPQASGQLIKLQFKEGDTVKRGQVLAEIDPRPYQAALDQAKATLARDQALLENAKIDLARYARLAKANAISQQQYVTQQATVRQDEASVLADKANVETAVLNLGYTKVRTPVSGLVGLRQVDLGNLVTADQTNPIVVVTEMQPMSVLFTLPEGDIGTVREEMAKGHTLIAEAYDRSNTKLIARGHLASVDNVVDPSTGTVKLRAMFNNADGILFPNEFVNIRLNAETLPNQTTVPAAAVQQGAEGEYVYVVNPNKTVSVRAVKTGITDNDRIQILSGVKPGDTVVIDGADRLNDGAKVSLPDARALVIHSPSPAPAGSRPAALLQAHEGRGGFAALNGLTPQERAQLRKLSPQERKAWFARHRQELEKRAAGQAAATRTGRRN